MTTDNLFFSSFAGVTQNSLMHNLHLTHAEEHNHRDIKHSSYNDSDQFLKLARTHTNNFSILTTNIESLNSKYDELIVYIEELCKIKINCVFTSLYNGLLEYTLKIINLYDFKEKSHRCGALP